MAAVATLPPVQPEGLQPDGQPSGDVPPISKLEDGAKPDQQLAPRPTRRAWLLVCVGLYLGALLYGKRSLAVLLVIHVDAKGNQVWTRQ